MPTVYERALEQRAALLAGDREVAARLNEAYNASERDLLARLKVLTDLIDAKRVNGEEPSANWLFQQSRFQKLIEQVETEMNRLAALTGDQTVAAQRRAIETGVTDAHELISIGADDVGVTASFSKLPTKATESVVSSLHPDAPLTKILDTFGKDAAKKAREALIVGVTTGQGIPVIRANFQAATDTTRSRATLIARTETLRAYRTASLMQYQEASHLLDGWIWTSTMKERTCPACLALHNTVHPLDEPFASHPACFPSGVMVTVPGVVGATSRWFDGEIVEIVTASGRHVPVTKNHPILTTKGWVAAGLLHEGDHLVGCRDAERVVSAFCPNDHQVPARIEQVAAAFGGSRGVGATLVPTAAEDFHGDGREGEVAVVWTDRLLRDSVVPALGEPLAHSSLVVGNGALGALFTLCATTQSLEGSCLAQNGAVSGFGVSSVLLGSAPCHHEPIRVAAPATRDACGGKPNGDSTPRNTVGVGEGLLRLAEAVAGSDFVDGEVVDDSRAALLSALRQEPIGDRACAPLDAALFQYLTESLTADVKFGEESFRALACDITLDRVLKIGFRNHSGHVYNLETKTGWYTAGGLIVHNCRCSPRPLIIGGKPRGISGEDWLAKQDEATQQRILGKSAAEAYKNGEVKLADFVAYNDNHIWGASVRVASLTDAKAARKGEVAITRRLPVPSKNDTAERVRTKILDTDRLYAERMKPLEDRVASLSAIADAAPPNQREGTYASLGSAQARLDQMQTDRRERMQALLAAPNPTTIKTDIGGGIGPRAASMVQAETAQFARYVSEDVLAKDQTAHFVSLRDGGAVGNRSRYEPTDKTIKIERGINPDEDRGGIVHEMGHWLEAQSPDVLRAAQEFYDRRTTGESLVSMNDATNSNLYYSSEMTRVDKFLNPYMGKDFPSRNGTEIVTMGAEMLYNEPERLARDDADYFTFLLKTLQGRR